MVRQWASTFGPRFWDQYGGRLLDEPEFAIGELVANAMDAGCDTIDIQVPSEIDGVFSVTDNGSGLTVEQFRERWLQLAYDRLDGQGLIVQIADGNKGTPRPAYGRHGRGRHGMFCFNNTYEVETWRDGSGYRFEVMQSADKAALKSVQIDSFNREGHGTKVSTMVKRVLRFDAAQVRQWLASRFLLDPEVTIAVNGVVVDFGMLPAELVQHDVSLGRSGLAKVLELDSAKGGRRSKFNGVAWWINNRRVGASSWAGYDRRLLYGRKKEAKRFAFIIQADGLADYVNEDWSALRDNETTIEARDKIDRFLENRLSELTSGSYKERKVEVLKKNRHALTLLPSSSRQQVANFLEEGRPTLQRLKDSELNELTELVTSLEERRGGLNLLRQISLLNDDDVEGLTQILNTWTVRDAQIVLDEIENRIRLIQELDLLKDDPSADELHRLHPLIAQGLWIFGPAYESVEYTSNQQMSTVLRKLFRIDTPATNLIRPDFVAVEDGSIGLASCNSHDNDGEVSGIDKVLIVELKRGGYEITDKDVAQAKRYADAIMDAGAATPETKFVLYILGTTVNKRTIPYPQGNLQFEPMSYSVLLRRAEGRALRLRDRIQPFAAMHRDEDLENVMAQTELDAR